MKITTPTPNSDAVALLPDGRRLRCEAGKSLDLDARYAQTLIRLSGWRPVLPARRKQKRQKKETS